MSFDQKYMFKVNNTVVIQHKGPGGGWVQFGSIRIKPNDHGNLGHNGKKGEFAQFTVEKHGGNHEKIKLKSKKSGKYVRIHKPDGNFTVDCGGGGGKWCVFNVHHGQNDVVKLENQETGKYLAVKEGNVTIGVGGPHCALKMWR